MNEPQLQPTRSNLVPNVDQCDSSFSHPDSNNNNNFNNNPKNIDYPSIHRK